MKTAKKTQFSERSKALQAVQRELQRIKGLHSVSAVFAWSGFSFKVFGERLAECEDRRTKSGFPKPYSKAQVHNWTRKKTHARWCAFDRKHRDALANLINDVLQDRLHDLGVTLPLVVWYSMNSPIKTHIHVRCEKCRQLIAFDLRRANPMRCKRCAE